MPEPNRTAGKRNDAVIKSDVRLVRAISDGSITAWHEFVNRYSGLICGIIRHSLVVEDEDDIRSVYVEILKSLYDGKLGMYRGEARLSTWLSVYTRSRALDFFRQRHGRYRTPKGYYKLAEFDREVLRLFYVERLPLGVVVHILRSKGFSVGAEKIIESVQRIDDTLDRRFLRRLDYEYHAKTWSVDSVRMLKYLIQLNLDYEERKNGSRPDSRLIEKEVHEVAERARMLISRLPPEERKVIFLRFNMGWSAKRIAKRLGLGGQRRVYALINKVLRKLKENILFGGE